MPCCLLLIIAILGPRIGMILLWLFSNFYDKPFDGFLLPLLGFFFMPFTTLAYGWAIIETVYISECGEGKQHIVPSLLTKARSC